MLDDDVTILVSISISTKCQISVNIVLVSDQFEKTGIGPPLVCVNKRSSQPRSKGFSFVN